jgi:transposase
MADLEKRAKRYPTDLTDAEWEIVGPFLPERGRKPRTDLREVLNALRYLARSGGGWRMLPKDFPPWQTVYWWFRRFVRRAATSTRRIATSRKRLARSSISSSPPHATSAANACRAFHGIRHR